MKKKFFNRFSLVLYFCIVGTVFSYGTKYEAEAAAYGGGNWVGDSDAGFSGTGYLRNFNDVGSYVEFSITDATAGAQDVKIYYTTGQAGSLNLYVNGTFVRKVSIPSTGGWSNWQGYAVNVTLNAGNNTIKFIHESDNTGNFFYYVDYLTVDLNAIAVTGVSVSPSTLSMPDLTTSQLSATVTPEDASNKTVTWSSSNTAVATVSASGLVSALTPGEATITATTNSGNLTSTCVVTVTPSGLVKYEAEDATRNDTYIVSDWPGYSGTAFINHFGAVGNSVQFTITGANAGAQDITVSYATGTGIVLNLYVNDVLVGPANFANTGGWGNWTNHVDNVTLNAGTNTIKYQKDISADSWLNFDYLTVAGSNVSVTGVTMSSTTLSVAVNATSQLTATVAPSDASSKAVTWSSSDQNVATVSASGLVTGVAAGDATITVTTTDGSYTATCDVTVTALDPTKYEAEDAAYGGENWVGNSDAGFSGTGYLRNFNDVGSYVEFTITGAAAGSQNVILHYTTGQAGSLNLYVNGVMIGPVAIPTTGGWSNWQDYAVNVTLTAGSNTIKFQHDADNVGNFFYYIDYLIAAGINTDINSRSENENGISLSQNPFSNGSLSIKLPEGATQLTIFDITGKAVYQTQVTKNEYLIDQSVFKSEGIYMVNLITATGSKTQKLIVTK